MIITPELERIANEIAAERERQDEKWGGPISDDTRNTPEDWCISLNAYTHWALQMHRSQSPERYRRRMLQVAALAVAACESFDRLERLAS